MLHVANQIAQPKPLARPPLPAIWVMPAEIVDRAFPDQFTQCASGRDQLGVGYENIPLIVGLNIESARRQLEHFERPFFSVKGCEQPTLHGAATAAHR